MTNPNIALLAFWELPDSERHTAFAHLRSLDRPQFFPLPKMPLVRKQHPGFHALVRHADVSEASRNAAVFSSEPTANSFIDFPPWLARYFGSMINMDDPRHAQIRRVVSRAFSPKILARTEENVRRRAVRIVDDLLADGPYDFVAQVAARTSLVMAGRATRSRLTLSSSRTSRLTPMYSGSVWPRMTLVRARIIAW
jgi:cytochrome P450